MKDTKEVIEFKWPWTMIPLDLVGDWIEEVKNALNPGESIYGKQIFVSGRREDKNILLIENDTDGTYVIVKFEKDLRRRRLKCTVLETLTSTKELSSKLKQDHIEAMNNGVKHG